MSNLQIGRNTDGKLSITVTDLTDTELSELIRVGTNQTTGATTPAKLAARKRPPIQRYQVTR